MPGRFPIFKLLIYFLLHIDVFLTVLRFLAGITLKICEFQVRLSSKNTLIPFSTPSKNTLIPFSREQRHKLGLTCEVSALIYVAYKSFIGQNNQPSLVALLCSAENAFVVFVLRNAQRTFIFGELQQFMV